MPETRQILAYEEPAKPFAGARFVLYGFDFDRKEKILSRLFEGGGMDAVNYGPDCTHVIVDKVVWDDPVCVTARRDGKTLVTGLWVEHSFDVGVPVDPASVIYRPVKDFSGIPGAQLLIVCLTGYQRQDRDDIMTMVGLMGANFSKPLVANKVTHLICYKFEGDKYELAKKIKKIKLVNHWWLEDCLKAWEILPEADYCKSGFELEMEAEAKDSEEETEDMTSIVDAGRKSAASPQQTLFQNKISHLSPAKPEILENDLYLTEPTYWASASNASKVLSTPGKEIYLNSVSVLNETRHKQLDLLSSCTAKSPEKVPFEMPSNRSEEEMVSHEVEKVLASASDGAKKSPDADVSKSSGKNHCKFTSGKSSLPRSSESTETIGGSTSVSNVDKLYVGGGFNISLERHQDGTSELKTPIKGTMSHLVNERTATSSEKRKTSDVLGPSNSPRVSCISKTLMEREMVENVTDILASGTSVKGSMGKGLGGPVSPITTAHYLREKTSMSPKKALNISKTPISEDKLECGEVAIQHYRKKGKKRSLSSNMEIKELPLSRAKSFHGEDKKHQSDILSVEPSSPKTNYGAEKSNISVDLDFLNEHTDPQVKPLKNKMPVNKTLGSRPSFRKGGTAKHKGSMNLKKVALQNEDFIHSVEAAAAAAVNTNMATISEKVGMLPPTNKDPSQLAPVNNFNKSGVEATDEDGPLNEEIKDPEDKHELEIDSTSNKEKASEVESPNAGNIFPGKRPRSCKAEKQAHSKIKLSKAKVSNSGEVANFAGAEKGTHSKKIASTQLIAAGDVPEEKSSEGKKRALGKTKKTKLEDTREEAIKNGSNTRQFGKKTVVDNADAVPSAGKTKTRPTKKLKKSADVEKENEPVTDRHQSPSKNDTRAAEIAMPETLKKPLKNSLKADKTNCNLVKGRQNLEVKTEPAWFILSGHKLQRKEFRQVIRRLKGRVCRDSHHWSYQATHFIVPHPIRTEKFFAAAASGSWVLKTDYLTASNEAGRFLSEESFEWHKKGLSEDGAINLEAPRKWRLLREKTGHGAFYGMRIVIYGECISPSLDTLKRVVKAGDGTILATSPPYSRFLQSRIDFAVVSPGMPHVDMWVQEFLRYEVPCVLADYLVEYVCKPGFSLERHVQYNTHAWAKKSLENLVTRVEEVDEDPRTPEDHVIDVACQVCGSGDRGEEMLICGDESGTFGCGVGAHVDCLDPPLVEVPEEDWFCPSCYKKRESTERISQDPKKRRSKMKK